MLPYGVERQYFTTRANDSREARLRARCRCAEADLSREFGLDARPSGSLGTDSGS